MRRWKEMRDRKQREERVPSEVKDEERTPAPKVLLERTLALLI